MKRCVRCNLEDGPSATIHVHHINGNHFDNRKENKIFLCANCHMTLHWKRWSLSELGMPHVEIMRGSHLITSDDVNQDRLSRWDLELRIEESNKRISALLLGLEYYKKELVFINEEHNYTINKLLELVLEGLPPYSLKEKCQNFLSDATLHNLETRQKLNLMYQEFSRQSFKCSDFEKIEEWNKI